jgi:hypothetical protein
MAEHHKAKVYVTEGHGPGHDVAEHRHGEMDITEHKKTFEGFIKFWVYLFGASAAILIFLALFST